MMMGSTFGKFCMAMVWGQPIRPVLIGHCFTDQNKADSKTCNHVTAHSQTSCPGFYHLAFIARALSGTAVLRRIVGIKNPDATLVPRRYIAAATARTLTQFEPTIGVVIL